MKNHLYLSLIPEALIASNLSPADFGNYFATGVFRRNCDQAVFIEIDPNFESDYLPVSKLDELCTPKPDDTPHKSVYLSVYRVLEHIPMSAFKNLYVVTSDGKTLELKKGEYTPDENAHLYLYQDLAPCRTRVASALNQQEYISRLTSEHRLVHMEKIAFCDLKLGALETDPENGELGDLPYTNLHHLRDCLAQSRDKKIGTNNGKNNFVVARTNNAFLYRTIKTGFYVGCGEELIFYPMPSQEELEEQHFNWWRSAQSAFGK